jgi:hypothetical protein
MADNKLKEYMQENFYFGSLKKAGVFPKEMKFNDYEGQAKVICHMFSLSSVYDYSEIAKGTRVHFSYCDKPPGPLEIPPHRKFVEVIGEKGDEEGRVVVFSKEVKYRLNND